MALPLCADLTLMMILSVVCQAEDGTVVDLRADQPLIQTQPLGPTLFGTPGSSFSSGPTTTTRATTSIETNVFSSSSNGNNNNNNDNDKRQRIPYCDEVEGDEYKRIGVCGDRKDGDDINGYPCGGGVYKANWRDCNGGLYGDNDEEIEYVEDHNKKYNHNDGNSNNIGEELGNIMEVEDDNNDEAGNEDADELVENIGDELGDVMKD